MALLSFIFSTTHILTNIRGKKPTEISEITLLELDQAPFGIESTRLTKIISYDISELRKFVNRFHPVLPPNYSIFRTICSLNFAKIFWKGMPNYIAANCYKQEQKECCPIQSNSVPFVFPRYPRAHPSYKSRQQKPTGMDFAYILIINQQMNACFVKYFL